MTDLLITFHGMILVGYGDHGEGWLVDTTKVPAGKHSHQHDLGIDDENEPLTGGVLVEFHDNGARLGGPVDFSEAASIMVDLDALMPETPTLLPALLDATPDTFGSWTDFLAAWIRLPSGAVNAQAKPFDVWPFAKDAKRTLSEQFTITVPDVQSPSVVLRRQGEDPKTIPIPERLGKFRVHVSTIFNGETNETPSVGDQVALDELLLLYACVTEKAAGEIPEKAITAEEVSAIPRLSSDVSICPGGAKRF